MAQKYSDATKSFTFKITIASDGGALTKGNVIVVPEPSTWLLFGLGSLTLLGAVRRRMA